MLSYYLLKAASKICCLLPRGACETIGRALGAFAWIFVPKRRKKLAKDQIMMCLGVGEQAERAQGTLARRFGEVRRGEGCADRRPTTVRRILDQNPHPCHGGPLATSDHSLSLQAHRSGGHGLNAGAVTKKVVCRVFEPPKNPFAHGLTQKIAQGGVRNGSIHIKAVTLIGQQAVDGAVIAHQIAH